MKKPVIGFVGMTHLGFISSAGAAAKGFEVICYDPLKTNPHIVEPHLQELLQENSSHLTYSTTVEDLSCCDIVYISPDIPTNSLGESDLEPIRELIQKILPHIKETGILVILSQVPPGFTRTIDWIPAQIFYHVETLIFGNAVHRTLFPERFIIGGADPATPLPEYFHTYLSAYECPLHLMSYESAELTKISINMFLVSSIATTNTIAELCEKIGADWREIAPALRLDKRIGANAYLSPGLGIAGGNLERDLTTFQNMANQYGTHVSIVDSWKKANAHHANWVLNVLYEHIFSSHLNPKICVLGLAYKKDTSSMKNSPSLSLISYLYMHQITCYDPVIGCLPDQIQHVQVCSTVEDAVSNANIVIIMTPWDEFSQLELNNKLVIDPFGIVKNPPQHYFTRGVSTILETI